MKISSSAFRVLRSAFILSSAYYHLRNLGNLWMSVVSGF
jgi:hypothetical protein